MDKVIFILEKWMKSIVKFKESTEVFLESLIAIVSWPIAVVITLFIFATIINLFWKWLIDKININNDNYIKDTNNYNKKDIEKQIKKWFYHYFNEEKRYLVIYESVAQ